MLHSTGDAAEQFHLCYEITKQAQEWLERHKNVKPPSFACPLFIYRKAAPKRCWECDDLCFKWGSTGMRKSYMFDFIRGGLEISLGARLCWFTSSSSAHAEGASPFDSLWLCTSTPNHTSEEGRKSNVWIIHCGSEKRSRRPISGPSVAAVTLPSLIHGGCLGCSLELAAEWLRVTCLPGNSETNSLESRWEMCLVTLLWTSGGFTSGSLFNQSDLKAPWLPASSSY